MHAQQGNKIVGNYIGTDKTGTADLGNGDDGVNISAAPNNTVGDTTVGARNVISRNEHGVVIYGAGATGNRVMQNVISRNDETGVAVSDDGAKGNRILSNSVFANGLLGIDLGADGPTANDPGDTDTGPNNLQNKPVLRQEGRHRHYHGQGHPELRPGQDLQRPVLLQPRGRGGGQEPPRLQVGYGRRNGQRLVRLLDD